jgi:hypothetical protein
MTSTPLTRTPIAVVRAHPADAVMIIASSATSVLSVNVVPAWGDEDRPRFHAVADTEVRVLAASPLTEAPVPPVVVALRPGWGLAILTDGPGTITADHVDPDGIVVGTITATGPITARPYDGAAYVGIGIPTPAEVQDAHLYGPRA